MTKPTLLVLAAGMGSRYGGLKQLDPVGPSGEIIIDYSIYDTIRAGFEKVVFVIRRDIEESFREVIGTRYENKINVEYAYQEVEAIPEGFTLPANRVKPWGTGHAIMMAEDLIEEPFAVINADDFYGRSGFKLLADYLSNSPAVLENGSVNLAMVGYTLRNTLSNHGTVARGICSVDSSDRLLNVVESTKIEKRGDAAMNLAEDEPIKELTGDEVVSLNFWGFQPSIFAELRFQFQEFLRENLENPKAEFFIPSVVDRMVNEGKAEVKVLRSSDTWFGVTYREDKAKVIANIKKLVDEGVYPENLFAR